MIIAQALHRTAGSPMAVEVYECPSCGASVDKDATECPKCGEIFEASALQVDEKERPRATGGRERMLFYAGVLLVLAGGPGIAVGSWLHDILHTPLGGSAYESFGWLNRLVAAAGLVILLVGIFLLILSTLRRTPAPDLDD